MDLNTRVVTKYINLSDLEKKVQTIVSEKLYMPFTFQFNDKFDCQIHLDEDGYGKLSSSVVGLKVLKNILIHLKYGLKVASLSHLNPLDMTSNHMWGLYADSGKGFAVSYNLTLAQDYGSHNEPKKVFNLFWGNMLYENKYSPLQLLQKYVIKHVHPLTDTRLTLEMATCIAQLIEPLVCTKSKEWEYEKEFRVYLFDIPWNSEEIEKMCNERLVSYLTTYKHEHEVLWFKPSFITIGWLCELNNRPMQQLITYAKKNDIPVRYLNGYIDYEQYKFKENNY